jgi:hypothetical protein
MSFPFSKAAAMSSFLLDDTEDSKANEKDKKKESSLIEKAAKDSAKRLQKESSLQWNNSTISLPGLEANADSENEDSIKAVKEQEAATMAPKKRRGESLISSHSSSSLIAATSRTNPKYLGKKSAFLRGRGGRY